MTSRSRRNLRLAALAPLLAQLGTLGCVDSPADLVPSVPKDGPPPLSQLVDPDAPKDYTIEAGQSFTIDKSYTVENLTIHGKLYCPTYFTEKDPPITITARSITVDGPGALFECGASDTARFRGKITILLRDDVSSHAGHDHAHVGTPATLTTTNGGTLRMFGAGSATTFGWQRIAADVPAGSREVKLETPVDWKEGDTIALGPSGFDYAEAEERVIDSVAPDRRSITVKTTFAHTHSAFRKVYTEGGRSATLDERPEIANLTRAIVVAAAGDPSDLAKTKRGAQIVVHRDGRAYVDGVEIARGGKLGVLAEYPFHWHLVGNAAGQFLRNSSIHHSFQRCVTIHGTNEVEVSNNVCFDHFGHGYFLENGNEVRNKLVHNLGMLSRRVDPGLGLLDSDMRSLQPVRFSAPATFWVSNPDNELVGNVASGSQGTGFWMSFSRGIHCGVGGDANRCDGPATGATANTVFPSTTPTLRFAENIAHSSVVGMNWDGSEDGELVATSDKRFTEPCQPNGNGYQCRIGARHPDARETVSVHYAPKRGETPAPPTFDSLQVWKNVATGVYYRGSGGTFTHFLAADNGRSVFFAYDQKILDGLVVGASDGVTASDVTYAKGLDPAVRLYYFAGTLIYDGPFDLERVHFADFEDCFGVPSGPFLNIGGANRFANRVRSLTFGDPRPRTLMYLKTADTPWADTPWSSGVRDDGSISGIPGLLVPNHPMNVSAGECTTVNTSAVDDGLSCRYTWGVMTFADSTFASGYDANRVPIKFERIERATGAIVTSDPLRPDQLTNKSGMISGLRYRYRLSISQPSAEPVKIQWVWQPEDGKVSPIVEIDGVAGAFCHPKGAPQVADLDVVTGSAYRWENGNLFMRVAPGQGELLCAKE